MLKLTSFPNPDGPVVLKLEGKLLAPWINELHHAFADLAAEHPLIHLDLSALSYVDVAGVRALTELIEQGAVVRAASGFVAMLLKRDTP